MNLESGLGFADISAFQLILSIKEDESKDTQTTSCLGSEGPYKRTQTAALRQPKFYLPQQAAEPQFIYCGSYVYEGSVAEVDEPR